VDQLVEARRAASRRRAARGRDRDARGLRSSRTARDAFTTCSHCSQWSAIGLCEWCDFDNSDEIAVAAHTRVAELRAATRADRWAEFRRRIAPPSRRGADASSGGPRQFMTCPACHQWTVAPTCEWCEFDSTDHAAIQHLAHAERFARRRWAARRRRVYSALRGLLRLDLGEQAKLLAHLGRWIVLGGVVGVLAGLSSALFLETLRWATQTRETHPWLLAGLPLAGFAVGLAYHYGGGRSIEGNNLIIDEIHDPKAWVPSGREGTALQMSGSLTDRFSRITGMGPADRRLLLIAAIAGGFGAVFGVPLAGCVFALEVQAVGRIRYDAIVPAFTASLVGDLVVRGLGVHHTPVPVIGSVDLTASLVLKVLVAGLLFGATAIVFSELTHGIKAVFRSAVRWAPARPLIGGFLVIGLTFVVGSRDYLGLSLPLISQSLAIGGGVVAGAFALKLLFTAVTLGSGFQGGEVTPLFVIGATLGATLGHLLGVPGPLLAAIGFVAVFAGATNTPLACTVMGVELFGSGPIVLLAVACIASYIVVGERGIYTSQRIDTTKANDGTLEPEGATLHAVARRRRLWLPAPVDGDQAVG
jgi:H+/Cl- antiporter ClcA